MMLTLAGHTRYLTDHLTFNVAGLSFGLSDALLDHLNLLRKGRVLTAASWIPRETGGVVAAIPPSKDSRNIK
jgi:hypothetical protein